jgi:hypothetical protein
MQQHKTDQVMLKFFVNEAFKCVEANDSQALLNIIGKS